MNDIKILGPNGQPLPPMRSKASMLVGGSRVPYDAADSFSDQLANWQPALWSPDNEINIYRDRIVSRVRILHAMMVGPAAALPACWITPSEPTFVPSSSLTIACWH